MYTCTSTRGDHAFFYELTRFSNFHREKPSIQYRFLPHYLCMEEKLIDRPPPPFFPPLNYVFPVRNVVWSYRESNSNPSLVPSFH